MDRADIVWMRRQQARAAYRREVGTVCLAALLAPHSLQRLGRVPGPRTPS